MMILLAIILYVGLVINFANAALIDKEFEACYEKEFKACLDTGNGLDEKGCENLCVNKCLGSNK